MKTPTWIVIVTLLLSLGALYTWFTQRELREARTRAAEAQALNTKLTNVAERKSWERVENAATTLSKAEPEKREEALTRFIYELHRLKSKVRFHHLALPKEIKEEP